MNKENFSAQFMKTVKLRECYSHFCETLKLERHDVSQFRIVLLVNYLISADPTFTQWLKTEISKLYQIDYAKRNQNLFWNIKNLLRYKELIETNQCSGYHPEFMAMITEEEREFKSIWAK